MADPEIPPDSPAGSASDPSALKRRVEAAQAERARRESPPEPTNASSLALRMGGEFGAAVLVGAGLGFGADYWLQTSPFGLVIGLGLGFITGVVNIVRASRAYTASHPVDPSAPSVPDDKDD
jgi:ATP synthase protein I